MKNPYNSKPTKEKTTSVSTTNGKDKPYSVSKSNNYSSSSSNDKPYSKSNDYNEVEVRELKLYGDNDYELYKNSQVPIEQNLNKKQAKGIYDSEKSEIAWKYHADRVAKKYEKDNGGKFSVADRKQLAKEYRKEYEQKYKDGEFNY